MRAFLRWIAATPPPASIWARSNTTGGSSLRRRGFTAGLPIADPNYALAFFDLGNVLDELQRLPEAIEAYSTAIRLVPHYGDAHYNVALAYERTGDRRAALRHWTTYIKLDPIGPWSNHARIQARKILEREKLSIVHRGSSGRHDYHSSAAREAFPASPRSQADCSPCKRSLDRQRIRRQDSVEYPVADSVLASQPASPLTLLSEDEQLFRATVRQFAQENIAPLVRTMDEQQHFHPELIPQLFNLGLMGIEIPIEYGGSGGTFFEAILAVEEISAVDPSVGVLIDVQNTLCINALLALGARLSKRRFLAPPGDRYRRRVRA